MGFFFIQNKKVVCFVASLLLSVCSTHITKAQINYANGTAVTENFNGLGSSATASLPSGWKINKSSSVRATPTPYASALTAVTGALGNNIATNASYGMYRFNANNNTAESAIGGLTSSNANSPNSMFIYVGLNNAGTTVSKSFDIQYSVEKYRGGTNPGGYAIQLYYSTDGTAWSSCGSNFLISYSADASNAGYTPAPLATATQNISATFTLPGTTTIDIGQKIYFAWQYSVASGSAVTNSQALGIDDISITPKAPPSFTVSPTSISNLNYTFGNGPSASQDFTLSGSNLNGTAVSITAPTNFEVSTNNTSFQNSISLSSYTGTNTTIYVRLKSGLNVNSYSGNISITGGGVASATNVAVSGNVTANAAITNLNASTTAFCNNIANTFTLSFDASGFSGSGIFTAELSSATGSFSSPISIGTLNSNNGTNLSINASIASNTMSAGTGYKIRVTRSTVISNEISITVNAAPDGHITALNNTQSDIICINNDALVKFNSAHTGSTFSVIINGDTYNNISDGSTINLGAISADQVYNLTQITDQNGCVLTQ